MKQKITIIMLFVAIALLSSYGFISMVRGYGTNDEDSCPTVVKIID